MNAALRHRGSREESEKENLANNNRLLPDSTPFEVCGLKKYKCKSLDVSLDELNTVVVTNINNNNTYVTSTTTGPENTGKPAQGGHFDAWPGLQSSTVVTVDGKEYPTTLPRLGTTKGGVALGESDDDEETEDLHQVGDEERRSLHRGGRRKTSAGQAAASVVIPVGASRSSAPSSASSASLRSKSLPHSVANSLDCLTNEAYEDDEDLLGQAETETAASKWSSKAVVPTGVTTIITTGGSSSSIAASGATHDKDFITKL